MIGAVFGLINHFLHEVGALAVFIFRVNRTFLTTRGNLKPIIDQVASISIRSLSTVVFAGIFTGAILVLQFNSILVKYDSQILLGGLNTSAVVRSIGPLIISFLLAGKIGAFTAAELGTMRVTEQIDAIRCLGTHPVQYLIVPRFMGIILSSPILLMIGLLISIFGSMAVAHLICGINYLEFASSIPRFTSLGTVLAGTFKCTVYGTIVAAVSCHKGYTATGGARGVGRAVTQTAIYTNLFIVIANYVTSHVLDTVALLLQMLRGIPA